MANPKAARESMKNKKIIKKYLGKRFAIFGQRMILMGLKGM